MKQKNIAILVVLFLLSISCTVKQKKNLNSGAEQTYGPRILPIDYDSLYRLDKPPAYKPFEVYGFFLLSVATQEVPLVMNPNHPVPEEIEKYENVTFKEIDGLKIDVDIYNAKADNSPNPLILIIHGGYWKSGDKSVHTQQAVEFVELGYTAASVNYRLSENYKFPGNIEDLRDCILFLTENAETYKIDASQIMTYGGSAGAHLSAFLALSANSDRTYTKGLDASAFKGAISLYGMHDLTMTIQREHPFTEQYIGTSFIEDPTNYIDASSVTHVDENDPPVLLMHGSIDGSVSVKNSDRLSAELEANGVSYTYDRIEGWPHGMDFFSPIGERTLWQIHKFLKLHMPSEKLKNESR